MRGCKRKADQKISKTSIGSQLGASDAVVSFLTSIRLIGNVANQKTAQQLHVVQCMNYMMHLVVSTLHGIESLSDRETELLEKLRNDFDSIPETIPLPETRD